MAMNVALWADNNIVATLSNYHGPKFLDAEAGMKRRKKDTNGDREQEQTEVKCPEQNKDYYRTFHQIDNGNGKEKNMM